ncbi:MAG: DUF4418 family protein [Oscillospiraceae bacterium]
MKNRIFSGAVFLILGLIIALGPQSLFAVCGGGFCKEQPAMGGHMACWYTGQAALGIGGVIALEGVLLFFFRNKHVRAGLSIAVALSGVLTVLTPTVLTGVCKMADMHCRELTLPALAVAGVLTALLAAGNAAYLLLAKKEARHDGNEAAERDQTGGG